MAVGVNRTKIKSRITPIAAGVVLSPEMTGDFQNHYVNITFFTDATAKEIVPKASMTGSVVLTATVNGVEWGTMWVDEDKNGTLVLGDAGELSGELSGTYQKVRATLGVTTASGATHCQVTVDSYKA